MIFTMREFIPNKMLISQNKILGGIIAKVSVHFQHNSLLY